MPGHPSARLERLTALLFPAVVREEVLGDLYERYQSPRQYMAAALGLAPLLLLSRVRRTAEVQLTATVALLVYLSYLGAAWLSGSPDAWEAALPAAVTIAGMVVADAYALWPHPVGGPLVGTVLAAILGSSPSPAAAAAGLLLASLTRMLLPPDTAPLQTAGGHTAPASGAPPRRDSAVPSWIAAAFLIAWALYRK